MTSSNWQVIPFSAVANGKENKSFIVFGWNVKANIEDIKRIIECLVNN